MEAKMIALPADFMVFVGSQEHNSGLTVGNRNYHLTDYYNYINIYQ